MPDLLRLCTAGSVDDGKSTMIGRLLYDARGVYDDQIHAVESASRYRGAEPIDFALFTDGLRAERERGITIDVAYRHFATVRRRFILADTPGHEEYTRNMATGASTADLAILLVDARRGILEQTRRHAHIARLMGVSSVVLAINKMDLVDFDSGRFQEIAAACAGLAAGASVQAIPLSALHGDNVVTRSRQTPWYDGPSLLEHLEHVQVVRAGTGALRFPVQLVVRVPPDFRGLAGEITAGEVHRHETVSVFPGGKRAGIARIVTWDGDRDTARAPMSVTLVLDRHVDAGRGDIVATDAPRVTRCFEADVVWMDERPARPGYQYLLKHATRLVSAAVDRPLTPNEIGRVTVTTTEPLSVDPYVVARRTGAFILIDPATTFTSGLGMVTA